MYMCVRVCVSDKESIFKLELDELLLIDCLKQSTNEIPHGYKRKCYEFCCLIKAN